jgi:hypothetical protein
MLTTIAMFFSTAWAWVLAHKFLLLPIIFIMLVLKLFAWLFKGFAVVGALLLKPDSDAHPRPLRPSGLGMRFFVEPHWDKARKLYVPKRKLF